MTERVTSSTTTPERALAQAVERGAVPAVVALAADRQGTLFQGAFGRQGPIDAPDSPPTTLDSLFMIASMTKAVTAVAALQLVERGALDLDAPLGDLLPELATPQVLDGFDEAGQPRLRAPRRPITMRHLLTHTAGFAYPTWNHSLYRLEQQRGTPLGALHQVLVFDPGSRWEYGTNLDWAGRVIEHLTRQSLEACFQAHIFQPLGMHDTSYLMPPARRARLVARHQRLPDGRLQAIDLDIPEVPAMFNGGGGLYSTGPDYLRFLRMLLGDGELDGQRILQPASVAELGTNHIGELNVEPLPTTTPERSQPVEFFPGMVKKWGLGGLINTADTPAGRSANSWAWAGLANTYFWLDPTRGVTGLIMTQILPFCDPQVLALFEQFERDVYDSGRQSS